MDLEIKKAIREEFLNDWVSQASKEEIVEKLIQNDDRAKAMLKAAEYLEKFIPVDEDTILMREAQREYLVKILREKDNI